MYIAAAVNVKQRLIPAVKTLHDQIEAKASAGYWLRQGFEDRALCAK
jgi:hypothetical protein